MKRDWICVIGAVIGLLTGVGSGIGGFTLLSGSLTEIIIGVGLINIGMWLVFSAISVILRQYSNSKKWLTAGIILFWIDGIINGFVLFESPQFSGQIINTAIVLTVLLCLWFRQSKTS